MGERMLTRVRTAITIAVLVVVLLVGVGWAWAAVTKPFPGKPGGDPVAPVCVDTPFAQGDQLRPDDVTVSVVNAGRREGLADQTLQQLLDAGFGAGDLDNAPDDAAVRRAQIWTDDPNDPAVLLLRTYFGPMTPIVDRDIDEPGITVVVGDSFVALQSGKKKIKVGQDATVCSPQPED